MQIHLMRFSSSLAATVGRWTFDDAVNGWRIQIAIVLNDIVSNAAVKDTRVPRNVVRDANGLKCNIQIPLDVVVI